MTQSRSLEQPLALTRWVEICSLSDIRREGARRIDIKGQQIAIFRTASDEVFAIDDRCPHAGGPLSEGIVHGDCVTCPLHNWVISLRDGHALGADAGATGSYQAKLKGERVLVALPEGL